MLTPLDAGTVRKPGDEVEVRLTLSARGSPGRRRERSPGKGSGYDPSPMSFPGGSAYAMVRDMAEGYLLVTERTFKMMSRVELDQLTFEIDRHLRELRGEQPALDDLAAIQLRQRRMQRLNSSLMMVRSYRQKQKP